jgi:hypothetical protein
VLHFFFRLISFFVEFHPSRPLIRIITKEGKTIGADGVVAVAEALRENSTLQRLDIVRM